MECERKNYSTYLFWFFIIAGLFLRWWDLGARPLHHDESIHVMFGRYFFDHPDFNFYKYNPEYHGPLLYSVLRFVYDTFGDSEATARGLIAVMGSAFLFAPYLFRKYLSQSMVLILTGAIALSPTLIYWSRFVREDAFVLTGMLLVLYGLFVAESKNKSFWVIIGAVFQYASKENSYVTLALIWAYLVLEFVYRAVVLKVREPIPTIFLAPLPFAVVILLHLGMVKEGTAYKVESYIPMHIGAFLGALLLFADPLRKQLDPKDDSSLAYRYLSHVTKYKIEFFISFVIGGFLFAYLFSAGFRYGEGVLDGLYRKGITYWLEKHDIERIKGPFLFHFYTLTWYEFLFIGTVVLHAVCFYRNASRQILYAFLGCIILAFVAAAINLDSTAEGDNAFKFFLWKKVKAKDYLDVFGAVILIVHPILVVWEHLRKREWKLSFWAYWFLGSFFTYSYLGEKVPWLSTYPFIAGIVYLGLYFDAAYKSGKGSWVADTWSWGDILLFFGTLLLFLGALFTVEEWIRFRTLRPGEVFQLQTLVKDNFGLIIFGVAGIAIGYLENMCTVLGSVRAARFLAVAAILFNLRAAILTNYERQYREIGYISQVHTTNAIVDIAHRVRSEIETKLGADDVSVLVTGDAVWPLTWYLRDLPSYKFSATEEEKKNFTYIFQNTEEKIPDGYTSRQVNLRGWWVPDFNQMTFKRFLTYALTQRGWGGPGFSYVNFLTKRGS